MLDLLLLNLCRVVLSMYLLQAKCLKSFKEMAGLVKRKSNEKATLAGVINDTAVIVETGLMNIIRASSDSARVFGEQAVKDDHLSVNSTKEKVTD